MSYTTEDLIRQVRSQMQEKNTANVNDAAILDALNRGQDYAFDLMAKHYPDPLAYSAGTDVSVDSNNEIDIIESSFEDRICSVEVKIGSEYHKLKAVSFRDIHKFGSGVGGSAPTAYAVIGRKIRILPGGSGYTYRVWYLREIERLVKSQGRITSVTSSADPVGAYVVLDSLGSDLSTSDAYNKYVNIIDSQTGEVKNTLEINNINTTSLMVEFKLIATRATVLNKTIDVDVSSTVQADDYVCIIDGTCVPYFKKPLSNYIIQYAVYEIRRSLGYDVTMEERQLKKLEDSVERTWAGRETTRRIARRNPIWRR
jgi:hypothetical protein